MRIPPLSVETLFDTRATVAQKLKEKSDVITQYHFLNAWLKAQAKTDRGAAMVEYALLLALIAIIAIAALRLLGNRVSENFSDIESDLQ